MKWVDKVRGRSEAKTYKSGSETKIPSIQNEMDFKKAVKAFHPDVSDTFLKGVNTKKMHELLKTRKPKRSGR